MLRGSLAGNRQKIEWKDSYNVGNDEIDSQHRGLLGLINEVASLAATASKDESFAVLNAMIKYAETHFRTEERYLEECASPDLPRQREEHEAFVEEAFFMARELADGGLTTLGGISIFLQEWFWEHVLGIDQGCKACLEKNTVKLEEDDPSGGPEAEGRET